MMLRQKRIKHNLGLEATARILNPTKMWTMLLRENEGMDIMLSLLESDIEVVLLMLSVGIDAMLLLLRLDWTEVFLVSSSMPGKGGQLRACSHS